jgi:Tol biopolymer transport system component
MALLDILMSQRGYKITFWLWKNSNLYIYQVEQQLKSRSFSSLLAFESIQASKIFSIGL